MAKLLMVLAQGPGAPHGDLDDRLELDVALTAQGQIDVAAFEQAATPWLARRGRRGGVEHHSELVRLDESWALQGLAQGPSLAEDPLWTVESRVFRPGELVRLRRADGRELLFRVVQVTPDA